MVSSCNLAAVLHRIPPYFSRFQPRVYQSGIRLPRRSMGARNASATVADCRY
jgi:hypothetical protein